MALSFDMESAGKLIARWKVSGDCVSPEALARAAWRVAVGKRIAARTAGLRLVRKHLIVQVDDEVWRRQLLSLRRQIVRNLNEALGRGLVEDLEIRLAPPRIGPGRAPLQRKPAAKAGTPADEADRIQDPILRRIYQQARRKASA